MPDISDIALAPSPIRHRKVPEVAAQRLEEMIRDGTFPAGTMLPSQRELMKLFALGRTSICEALLQARRPRGCWEQKFRIEAHRAVTASPRGNLCDRLVTGRLGKARGGCAK